MGDLCSTAGKNGDNDDDDDDDDTSSATAAKKNAIAMANAEAPPNTTSPVLLSHATQERRT
jgi:cyclophilin family peptidyl-prolyl cis-trans isomerase